VQYTTTNNSKFWAHGIQGKISTKEHGKYLVHMILIKFDHLLVSKRWATHIENIRTYRGPNSDSDHFLVGARLKQKIALITRNNWKSQKMEQRQISWNRRTLLPARSTTEATRKTTFKWHRGRMDIYKGNNNHISTKYNRGKAKWKKWRMVWPRVSRNNRSKTGG
jgi:hypothetical protein